MEKKKKFNKKTLLFVGVPVLLVAIIITIVMVSTDGNINIAQGNVPLADAPLTVSSGDRFVVTVVAASFEDMYGYQFNINYDKAKYSYVGPLVSDIKGLDTIFSKPFDGYELVGATMIGTQAGVSGTNQPVCHLTFEALQDDVVTTESLRLSDVSVVSSTLDFVENIPGWNFSVALASD